MIYTQFKQRLRNLRLRLDNKNACPRCRRVFSRMESFLDHKRECHKSWICPICTGRFLVFDDWYDHVGGCHDGA